MYKGLPYRDIKFSEFNLYFPWLKHEIELIHKSGMYNFNLADVVLHCLENGKRVLLLRRPTAQHQALRLKLTIKDGFPTGLSDKTPFEAGFIRDYVMGI